MKHPERVRRYIRVAAQEATLDPLLTGRQNLVIVGDSPGWVEPRPGPEPYS